MISLFPEPEPRCPKKLITSGLDVIDQAFAARAVAVAPLFSGGDDSQCSCHVAAQHPQFTGEVHHIATGIGARLTREHVNEVCDHHGWRLRVHQSDQTYEQFVRDRGFPGPGRHQWIYNRIKDRCVRKIMRKHGRVRVALITGCRQDESIRRMGHVEPVKVGETSKKTGEVREKRRIWTAPCHDWTATEQAAYMDEHDLPRNPVKPLLGMSGECFCGAFASPGELDRIRRYVPDVATEIDRLTLIAQECGTHDRWGTRPPDEKGLIAVKSGPLCSNCDRRAYAAGLLFED